MDIRQAKTDEFELIWPIFHEVVQAGETYAYAPETDRVMAERLWMIEPQVTFVAEVGNRIVGTYYVAPNQPGLGGHVCTAAFMVKRSARGHGVGQRMCLHALTQAKLMGYKAMQFNLVVSGDHKGLRLWQKLGFEIVGTLPKAFNHRRLGYVDAHVMYQWFGG
ncbi:MAG TPA: GNAT family N-acetyltransferase [Anaerolineae bacterium]|nr:GNAT family N-acetyltransferase [Anaerolineae bacterium]